MKVVIQRVKKASVEVDSKYISQIGDGFVILVGLAEGDTEEAFEHLINKIMKLRIFSDEHGKMNKSLVDTGHEVLLISQFTLYADCQKGNRPSFVNAMKPEKAIKLYENFVKTFKLMYNPDKVKDGLFGAHMRINLINDGPVTIILEI